MCVSLPDVSTLESRPVLAGGRRGYFQPGYCNTGSLNIILAGGARIYNIYSRSVHFKLLYLYVKKKPKLCKLRKQQSVNKSANLILSLDADIIKTYMFYY